MDWRAASGVGILAMVDKRTEVGEMRELLVLMNEYPWTCVMLFAGVVIVLRTVGRAVHG